MKPALRADLREILASGLTTKTPAHLWSRPYLWRRHLRHWPDTGRQQDAAQFLSFFRQACALTHFKGTWNIISHNSLIDSGSVCPLMLNCEVDRLPMANGICALPKIVEAWHNLPGTPTLASGTACVVLQLNRFRTVGGVVTKTGTPVTLPATVNPPIWVEGSTTFAKFLLSAVVIHLGSSPHQGHYRVLLVEEQGRAWITEDGIAAQPPHRTVQENAYFLYLRPYSRC